MAERWLLGGARGSGSPADGPSQGKPNAMAEVKLEVVEAAKAHAKKKK